MDNQNNHRRVSILGIVVDSVSVPRAVEISQGYINNDYFNFVLLAGARLAMESQESEEVSKFVNEADLILPGDHNIEKIVEQKADESYQSVYLDSLLSALAEANGHLCILCDTDEVAEIVARYIEEDYPNLKVDSVVYEQSDEESLESLVNKVNGFFPDMVLPLVSLEKQQALLLAHKETLSTKLYISSETLTEEMMQSEKDSPRIVKWLKKCLHLGKEAVDDDFWQKYTAWKEGRNSK